MVGFLLPAMAFSQELKICESGISACQGLIKDVDKYKSCMVKNCSQMYNKEEIFKTSSKQDIKKELDREFVNSGDKRPLIEVKTCEYGSRKCNSLKSEPEYYWECMLSECNSQPEKFVASCKEGHFMCKPEMEEYLTCLGFHCPKTPGSLTRGTECDAGKQPCINNFDYFWNCVYAICLGPVEHYKRASETKKYIITEDKKGNKRRVILDNSSKYQPPSDQQNADFFLNKGYDYREFTVEPSQKYMSTGNPSLDMQCLSGSMLRCKNSSDLRSCFCTDGTVPIFNKGLPDPRFGR
ncbi:MAG TPA: hypothetical protein DIV86_03800 [Alphaproteobacteria bacterium]|nr:hypothetical protein [Alphaproteobacteria bacterium]